MTCSPYHFDAQRLADWSQGSWSKPVEQTITGVVHDSRAVKEGSLYIAIKGDTHDGHAFVRQAVEAGAAGALVERGQADTLFGCPLLCVEDTRESLKHLARAYRASVGTLIVGVTGSAGKTTVKDMLADVLETQGRTSRTPGNWNNDIGLPLSILGMQPRSEYGVFEVGTNHPGEIGALCDILQPLCGTITSIGAAHIGHFGSVDAIADEKAALLRSLPKEGVAVLDRDDERFDYFRDQTAARIVTISLHGDADYIMTGDGRVQIREPHSGESYPLSLPLPGVHVKQNALRAIAIGREFGLAIEPVTTAIAGFEPGHMRWQEAHVGGLHIINDAYNANPLSMSAAIDAFAIMDAPAGKWLVLGGMHELGDFEQEAHEELGALATEGDWAGVLFVGAQAEALAAGASGDRFHVCADNAAAVEVLRARAAVGDAILLKGSRAERLETIIDLLESA